MQLYGWDLVFLWSLSFITLHLSISQERKKKKKNDLEHKNIGRNFKKTMGQIETYHSIQSVTEM